MRVKLGNIANPYSVFAIIWAVSLGIYLLQWSEVFPPISDGLLIYLSAAIIFTTIAGFIFSKLGFVKYVAANTEKTKNIRALFIFNICCWLLNFLYSGIPLLLLLRGADIDIHEFGIPTFKVFVLSFNSFFCVYLFHNYLSTKNKKYLLGYAVCLLLFVLIFSRGLIMMTIVSTFFLWLLKKRYIGFGKIVGVLTMALLILYIFGVAGNIRTAAVQTQADGLEREYSSDMILNIGKATHDFKNNYVPNEFFWGFLYIASPISNLQYNLDRSRTNLSVQNTVGFFSNELTWDFVSKRINDLFNIPKYDYDLIVPELSVCTTFTGSYVYLGWIGLVLFLLFLLMLPIIYIPIIGKNSSMLPVMLSILSSIYFFSFFDNMFIYSGLGLQIIYPVLFKYTKIA